MNVTELPMTIFRSFCLLMSRLGRHEWYIWVAVVLILGGLWLTVDLTEVVVTGETHTVDQMLLLSLREPDDPTNPLGPRWFEEMIRDFTSLGGTGMLTLIVTAVSGYLFMIGRYRKLVILLTAVIGGVILSFLLKDIFDRPRPDLVLDTSYYTNPSFPSGHSLLAAVTYLTLGSLLAQIQRRFWLKVYIIFLSLFVMVLVGFSRIYLGVHWPSDVLAGWTIGATWALLCWLVAHWLQQSQREAQKG